jgi:ribosomal protein S15P/S13E
LIAQHKRSEADSGSSEVASRCSHKENNLLTEHLTVHKRDRSSRCGLMMVSPQDFSITSKHGNRTARLTV